MSFLENGVCPLALARRSFSDIPRVGKRWDPSCESWSEYTPLFDDRRRLEATARDDLYLRQQPQLNVLEESRKLDLRRSVH
jgi:hypothetical protein